MFSLGSQSIKNLQGVKPNLGRVVNLAIQLSEIDFSVHEGLRSVEQQRKNMSKGVSWTMNSKHLTGDAIDLVPYIDADGDGDKELSWDWPACYKVAHAMRTASAQLGVRIVWGGVWDKALTDLQGSLEDHVKAYAARMKKLGKTAKLDGPHFELLS